MSDPAITGNGGGLQIGSLQISTPQPRTSESPIQRLHPELLDEIFQHCLYIYDYPSGGERRLPRPSVQEVPLILCRICQHWRQLVLANPLLWAQIELSGKEPSSHLAALDEWLARSQRSPLHLSVSYFAALPSHGRGTSLEDGTSRVVAKLLPHFWRWKYACFKIIPSCVQPILEKLRGKSDNLQTLKICACLPSFQAMGSFTLDVSSQKVLSEFRMDYRSQFIHNHSSMNNVRTLHISTSTIDGYLRCLDVCPAATDIEFIFKFDFQLQMCHQPVRVRPSVTALTLRVVRFEDESQSLGKILALLEVPNLRKLTLFLCKSPEEWNHASEFIRRSNPPLLSFTAGGPMANNHFFQCLRHMSHLQTLHARFSMFDRQKLTTLINRPQPGQPFTCPELREIDLDSTVLRHVLFDVAELVLHRWYSSGMESDSPTRISTVTLRAVPPKDGRSFLDYPRMRQCIRDGLRVRFL